MEKNRVGNFLSIGIIALIMLSILVVSEVVNAIPVDPAYWQESYQERVENWDKAPAVDPCLKKGTSIVVHTYMHRLYLCENNKMVLRYNVAIGRGGINKTTEGDLKTPIGLYPLSTPRASTNYSMFIPVGYPTLAQKKLGYTGSGIGIHGPYFRYFQMWGFLSVLFDWTQGCVAVGTDFEMEFISNWATRFPDAVVHILDERHQT
ncbi:MAG: L,D-transpeptidase family protein [Bdellovibrionota bacterium]